MEIWCYTVIHNNNATLTKLGWEELELGCMVQLIFYFPYRCTCRCYPQLFVSLYTSLVGFSLLFPYNYSFFYCLILLNYPYLYCSFVCLVIDFMLHCLYIFFYVWLNNYFWFQLANTINIIIQILCYFIVWIYCSSSCHEVWTWWDCTVNMWTDWSKHYSSCECTYLYMVFHRKFDFACPNLAQIYSYFVLNDCFTQNSKIFMSFLSKLAQLTL